MRGSQLYVYLADAYKQHDAWRTRRKIMSLVLHKLHAKAWCSRARYRCGETLHLPFASIICHCYDVVGAMYAYRYTVIDVYSDWGNTSDSLMKIFDRQVTTAVIGRVIWRYLTGIDDACVFGIAREIIRGWDVRLEQTERIKKSVLSEEVV